MKKCAINKLLQLLYLNLLVEKKLGGYLLEIEQMKVIKRY